MSKVLVSSIQNDSAITGPSDNPRKDLGSNPENLRPFTDKLLLVLKGAREDAINFMQRGRVNGVTIGKSDRELILHYAARRMLSEVIADPDPKDEAVDLDRQTQWENLIAILLQDAHGNVARANRTPWLMKACEEEVHTLESVEAVAHTLVEVPQPNMRTPTLTFVRMFLNNLEGAVAERAQAATAVPETEREKFKEFGRILAGRFFVGFEGARHFLEHELSNVVGVDASDREIIFHFATRNLIERSTPQSERLLHPEKIALAWSALFNLAAHCGTKRKGYISETHTPMARAFEAETREGADLAQLSQIIPLLPSDRHQMYMKQLIADATLSKDQRLAA